MVNQHAANPTPAWEEGESSNISLVTMTETSSAAAEENTAGCPLAESGPEKAAGRLEKAAGPPGVHQVGRRPSEERAPAAETPFLGVKGTVSRMFFY
jgi:hypothetical protein